LVEGIFVRGSTIERVPSRRVPEGRAGTHGYAATREAAMAAFAKSWRRQ